MFYKYAVRRRVRWVYITGAFFLYLVFIYIFRAVIWYRPIQLALFSNIWVVLVVHAKETLYHMFTVTGSMNG